MALSAPLAPRDEIKAALRREIQIEPGRVATQPGKWPSHPSNSTPEHSIGYTIESF